MLQPRFKDFKDFADGHPEAVWGNRPGNCPMSRSRFGRRQAKAVVCGERGELDGWVGDVGVGSKVPGLVAALVRTWLVARA